MKRKPKNGLKKLNESIDHGITEQSVTERMKARSHVRRALDKGAKCVGPVSGFWDGDQLIIPREALMKCLFGMDWEDYR